MLTLEQVVCALRDRRLKSVSESTGLAYDTIWRIARGTAKDPSYAVIKKLSDYILESQEDLKHG